MISNQHIVPHEAGSYLFQLPDRALCSVLKKLKQWDRASTAATCRKLSHDVVAYTSNMDFVCRSSAALASFELWLDEHNSGLTNLTQCTVNNCSSFRVHLPVLPWSQLQQLNMKGLFVQFGPYGGCSGVLHDCAGLTTLALQSCTLDDAFAAARAIETLPQLRSLSISGTYHDQQGWSLFQQLQLPTQLTYLSWNLQPFLAEDAAQLSQLSGLLELKHLTLPRLPWSAVTGLPSQLVKLTCLEVSYDSMCDTTQLQHLSCLTALQRLSVSSTSL